MFGSRRRVPTPFYHIHQDGELVMMDPGQKEEAAQAGRLTVVVNAQKEVCAVHKPDGVPLTSSMVSSGKATFLQLSVLRHSCFIRLYT